MKGSYRTGFFAKQSVKQRKAAIIVKRLLLLFFSAVIVLYSGLALPAVARGQTRDVTVAVDGLPVAFDVPPVIRNGRTLVPFRAIAEAINVSVTWDGATGTVSAADGKTTVKLLIGHRTAYCNGSAVPLNIAPAILGGRTVVPLRFFSEVFGCTVTWDATINSVQIASAPKTVTVMGFYALGDAQTSSWTDLFGAVYPETSTGNTDMVSVVALGWYSLSREGALLTSSATGWRRPPGWEKVLESAERYGLKTEMMVHLTDSNHVLTGLLSDEAASATAVAQIVKEAGGYQGVNLDFEGLGLSASGEDLAAVRHKLTEFVRLLSAQLKSAGKALTLTLHAPNSVYRGYDYEALGELSDRIVIMAYDYGPKPEPVSLVTEAAVMAKAVVPPEKLLLGISAPGETPESMFTKVGIAKRHNLAGIALWRLGLLSQAMWDVLRTTVTAGK
jgi:hypothetical protein